MLLCDTNIFIEVYRCNMAICTELERLGHDNIAVSDVTRAELFYGALNKSELKLIRRDLDQIATLHINTEILRGTKQSTFNSRN